MTESNLKAIEELLASAEKDTALQAELVDAKDLETVVKIGKDHGYDFTMEDLQAASAAGDTNSGELSDNDLDSVAGGMTTFSSYSFFAKYSWSRQASTQYRKKPQEQFDAKIEQKIAASEDAADDHEKEGDADGKPVPMVPVVGGGIASFASDASPGVTVPPTMSTMRGADSEATAADHEKAANESDTMADVDDSDAKADEADVRDETQQQLLDAMREQQERGDGKIE